LENNRQGDQQDQGTVPQKPIHHGQMKHGRHYGENNKHYDQATQYLVCPSAADEHQEPIEYQSYDKDIDGARDIKPGERRENGLK
jgi:hypothetical protein